MNKFITILAALILGATFTVPASASPVGKPFLHGISSPAELASKVDASLAKNSKGTSIIDPDRCKSDGSCASPLNYLEALHEADPAANLTDVAQVPDFLRSLQVISAPAGEYWISCLKPSGQGTYKTVLHCLSRSFKPGEKAWVDTKTSRVVFASDCTNVVEKPVPPKHECVEIHFTTKPGDTIVRFALLGPHDVKDGCTGVKRAGEADFERWWADECAVVGCDFSADAQVAGQPVRLMGSYVPAPGEHVLRLPAFVAGKGSLYRTVLCLERGDPGAPPKKPPLPTPEMDAVTYRMAYDVYMTYIAEYKTWRDAWLTSHSDGIGVQWFDYLQTSPDVKVATVWYTEGEIPKNSPSHLYWPWGEWEAH